MSDFAFFRLSALAVFSTFLLIPAHANPVISAAPGYGDYYQQQSPLGGGLIEALVGAVDAPVRYAAPPAAPAHPSAHLAAYAPEPAEVQRAIDPIYMRAEVEYSGPEAPGTIVVDTPNKFLYFVHGRGRATRYGIGVGRPGFEWSGVKTISRKAEWPDWTPPAQMLARRPDLPRHMDGGPANPLGARAMYLGSSLYRIHGTNEPHTIGQNVSSGCIRMMNDDVVDLYNRTPVGTRVLVR
jgi:lipoprotein-anchoring transpeptidase ErfK/SrfK